MSTSSRIKWILVIAGGWLLALAAAWPGGRALAHGPSTGGAPLDAVKGLFNATLLLAIPIFLLVEGLILFAVVRYRRRRADEMPDQVHGNTPLELTWTVLSFLIVAVLFVLTLRALKTDYRAEAENEQTTPDFTVNVIGYMYNWDYEYLVGQDVETGVRSTRRMKIPTDRNVLLNITSRDVQHSFWVPDLAGKVDAVPGYDNTMWLRVDEPGVYTGNCAEYCGTMHYAMLIEVEAMPPGEFEAWLADSEAAASAFQAMGTDMESEMPDGDAARGEGLFNELTCSSCHNGEAGAGPALYGMGERAEEHGEAAGDLSAEQYLRQSVLLPCAYEVPGFNCEIMPKDYGEKLDAQQLADLIAFLEQH